MELRSIFTFIKIIQERSMKTLLHFYTFDHRRHSNDWFLPSLCEELPCCCSPLKHNDTLCYSPWKIMSDKEKSVLIRARSQLRWPYWVLFSENCTREMHSAMTGSYTKQFPNNIEPPKGENPIIFWSQKIRNGALSVSGDKMIYM